MGAYWGSRWFAVLGDPETAQVEQVDLVPFGVTGTSDRLICPAPPNLEGCQSFESELGAVRAVKEHVLKSTADLILPLVVAIESTKLSVERCRMMGGQSRGAKREIEEGMCAIEALSEELKRIRKLRRAKITVN